MYPMLFVLVFIIPCFSKTFFPKNNICKTYEAYNYIHTSPDCYYDPDADLVTMEAILNNHVERFEIHNVTTLDGYILNIYRIPQENPKGVVLLVHPLTADALLWVSIGNASILYYLIAEGYDVWMPSLRGTFISHQHVNLSADDYRFSDFSFHEIGMYDTKAFVEYVGQKTNNSEIVYIGYSMSSITAVIYGATYPEEAKKYLKVIVAMATPYQFKYMTSPIALVASPFLERMLKNITDSIQLRSIYQPLGNDIIWSLWYVYPFNKLFVLVYKLISGWVDEYGDPTIVPVACRRLPRGFSTKIFYHFWQIMNSNRFQYFDYGERNMEVYGQRLPPRYPIERVKVPVYLMYSDADTLTSAKDNEELYNDLPKEAKIYGKHKIEDINHCFYFVSINTYEHITKHILDFMDKIMQ